MQEGNIQILDLDFEYKLWHKRLQYYQYTIKLMLDRIGVLYKEHADFSFTEENELILKNQLVALEKTANKIKTLEQEISHYAVDYPISDKHLHYKEHEMMRLDVDKLYKGQKYIMESIYPVLCYPFDPII